MRLRSPRGGLAAGATALHGRGLRGEARGLRLTAHRARDRDRSHTGEHRGAHGGGRTPPGGGTRSERSRLRPLHQRQHRSAEGGRGAASGGQSPDLGRPRLRRARRGQPLSLALAAHLRRVGHRGLGTTPDRWRHRGDAAGPGSARAARRDDPAGRRDRCPVHLPAAPHGRRSRSARARGASTRPRRRRRSLRRSRSTAAGERGGPRGRPLLRTDGEHAVRDHRRHPRGPGCRGLAAHREADRQHHLPRGRRGAARAYRRRAG